MPRRRYYRRPISYRRYRRYRRSYARGWKRARGTSRIASSRSRISVRVPWTQSVTLTWSGASTTTPVVSIQPFRVQSAAAAGGNVTIGGIQSDTFRAYSQLFDEVKCDGIKATFSVTTPIGAGAALPAAAIISAVDRRLGYNEGDVGNLPTTDQLGTYSSVSVRNSITNSVAKVTRSIWASDLIERTQFIDSTINAANNALSSFVAAGWNPNMFCPGIMLGVGGLPAPGAGVSANVQIYINAYFYYTFRNPKYAPVGQSKEARVAEFEEALERLQAEHPEVEIEGDIPVEQLLEEARGSGAVVSVGSENPQSDDHKLSSTKMEE